MRVLLVAVSIALLATASSRAQEKPSWETVRGSGFQDVPLRLVPIGDQKQEKRPDAKDVWSGLVEGMARDANTQKLLKRLLNCQTVKIAVLPKKVDGTYRPAEPTGKSQVHFGVLLSAGEVGKDEFKGCMLGSAACYAFEVPDTRKWDENATVWDAFLIAANEYLHRNKKGYHLHHGLLLDPADLDKIDEGIRDTTKRGKYLARKIKDFLDTYKSQ